MAHELVMPRLSDSMEEGTIVKWLASVGDEVSRGQEIVEIETDKATMPYESDGEGTLVEILAEEGDTLPIGQPIARLGERSEVDGDGGGRAAKADEGAEEEPEEPEQAEDDGQTQGTEEEDGAAPGDDGGEGREPATAERGERVKASPIARRIAEDRGIELSALTGSGPGGRIIKADVESAADDGAPATRAPAPQRDEERAPAAAAEAAETAKGRAEQVELSRLQETVARRMAESKATVPHFELEMEVDMSEAVALRDRLKQLAGEDAVVPSYNDLVIKACARALRDHPRANGSYKDGRFELHSRVNVGIAVAAQDALVVPTIFDADTRTLTEIATTSRELAGKVREGTVRPPELSGGTFTVSNLGMYGIERFTAVINPPQAAILAVGRLARRATVDEDGFVAARHAMNINLACDHRILYGAEGAEFLASVRSYLEQPLLML